MQTYQSGMGEYRNDPRQVFVDVINGKWKSLFELASMFENEEFGCSDSILESTRGLSTKDEQLAVTISFYMGEAPEPGMPSIRIYVEDLRLNEGEGDYALAVFTEEAIWRLERALFRSGNTDAHYANKVISSSLRRDVGFKRVNGVWKCILPL